MAFLVRKKGGLYLALKEKDPGYVKHNLISANRQARVSSLHCTNVVLQLAGGGLVPLSRARCCRPCLPTELPDSQGQLSPDSKPVAVVSIGCHKSSGQGSNTLKCEPQGSSFVTGFGDSIRVSNAANYFYPVGAVDCCTPSVLLSTGEAWELERCDCEFSVDINCGEKDNNRLLQGFERWRSVLLSHHHLTSSLGIRDLCQCHVPEHTGAIQSAS